MDGNILASQMSTNIVFEENIFVKFVRVEAKGNVRVGVQSPAVVSI